MQARRRASRLALRAALLALLMLPALVALPVPTEATGEEVVARLPSPRYGTAAVWTGTEAYVFGGSGGGNLQVVRFRPHVNTVAVVATLPATGFQASAVWTGSKAYLFGGGEGGAYSDKILVYDRAANTAQATGAVLPTPRKDTAAIWDGQDAYVFGGYDGARLDTIVKYAPSTGTVTTLSTRLPSPRFGPAAVWVPPYAYIFGGNVGGASGTDEILRFHPATGTLTTMAGRLPAPAFHMAAAWEGTNVTLVGGCCTGSNSPVPGQVVTYAPSADAHAVAAPASFAPRYQASAVWDGASVVAFGGWLSNNAHSDEVVALQPAAQTCEGPASVDLDGDAAVAAAAAGGAGGPGDPYVLQGLDVSGKPVAVALRNVTASVRVEGARLGENGIGLCAVDAPAVVVAGSDLVGNGQAIRAEGAGTVVADGSYWGGAGPNASLGVGPNRVSANVRVGNWRLDTALALPPGNVSVTVAADPGAGGYARGDAAVGARGTGALEGATVWLSLNSGPRIEVSSNGSVVLGFDRCHSLRFYASASAPTPLRQLTVCVDATTPVVQVAATSGFQERRGGLFLGPRGCIAVTALDATSGIRVDGQGRSVHVRLDGGPWTRVGGALCVDALGLREGPHEACAYGVDAAGNAGALGTRANASARAGLETRCLGFEVDTTPPALAFVRPVPGSVSAHDLYLEFGPGPRGALRALGESLPAGPDPEPTAYGSPLGPTLDQAFVSGRVPVVVDARDAGVGVRRVTLLVDGTAVGELPGRDDATHYAFTLDADALARGPHTLRVAADDWLLNGNGIAQATCAVPPAPGGPPAAPDGVPCGPSPPGP